MMRNISLVLTFHSSFSFVCLIAMGINIWALDLGGKSSFDFSKSSIVQIIGSGLYVQCKPIGAPDEHDGLSPIVTLYFRTFTLEKFTDLVFFCERVQMLLLKASGDEQLEVEPAPEDDEIDENEVRLVPPVVVVERSKDVDW